MAKKKPARKPKSSSKSSSTYTKGCAKHLGKKGGQASARKRKK